MYIVNTCKHIWVYVKFCYANDRHQVALRGKRNQAKTRQALLHLNRWGDQASLPDKNGSRYWCDCTVKMKTTKQPKIIGLECHCLLENIWKHRGKIIRLKICFHDPFPLSDHISSYLHFQQLLDCPSAGILMEEYNPPGKIQQYMITNDIRQGWSVFCW